MRGFSGDIWLFWKQDEVTINPVETSGQHITVEIAKVEEEPWLFSAVYASPDSTILNSL